MYNTVFFHKKITALQMLQKESIKTRSWPVLYTITYFFLIHTPSSSAEK